MMDMAILGKRSGFTEVPIDPVPLSHTITIATVSILFLVVTWITVALRFYTRIVIVRILGWDDWIMLFTLVRIPSALLL
jgi:hypothetical protein